MAKMNFEDLSVVVLFCFDAIFSSLQPKNAAQMLKSPDNYSRRVQTQFSSLANLLVNFGKLKINLIIAHLPRRRTTPWRIGARESMILAIILQRF